MKDVLKNPIVVIILPHHLIYVHHVVHHKIHSITCQLYLNKARGKKQWAIFRRWFNKAK